MIRIESMKEADRNRRLYETLKGMGLYVAITYDPAEPDVIDSLTVSARKPKVELVPFNVGSPLEGSEVGKAVRPSAGLGDNVVNLPTKS